MTSQNLCFFFVWQKFLSFFVSFEDLKTSSNHEVFFKRQKVNFEVVLPIRTIKIVFNKRNSRETSKL